MQKYIPTIGEDGTWKHQVLPRNQGLCTAAPLPTPVPQRMTLWRSHTLQSLTLGKLRAPALAPFLRRPDEHRVMYKAESS